MNSGQEIEGGEPHLRFVRQVMATRTVWGLKSSDGWAITPSRNYPDRRVMPFWSERASAKSVAVGDWAGWQPTSIKLDAFIHLWLEGMQADGILVGTDWDAYLNGDEIEPVALEKELLNAGNTK